MHDPIAAGRRAALRAIALQAVVAGVVAAAFLVNGPGDAIGAGIGGVALVLGNTLAAWSALSGAPAGAGTALGKLLLGVALKWVVVVGGLILAIAVWRLPALPVLTGAVATTMAWLMALRMRT